MAEQNVDPDLVLFELRSELRRIIRLSNFLNRPLSVFVPIHNRPPERPTFLVCFDLDPQPIDGVGLLFLTQVLAHYEERLNQSVFEMAGLVWHLKDRLKQWCAAKGIVNVDVEGNASQHTELLVASDLINRKKHGNNRNRSGLDPVLSVTKLDTSNSGLLELWLDGAVKEYILLVTQPEPIRWWVDILQGDGTGRLPDDPAACDSRRIDEAGPYLRRAFARWLPLLDSLGVLHGDDRVAQLLRAGLEPLRSTNE